MGILMMLQSILGISAGKLVWSNPGVAKHLYQFFWPSMIVTFFINLTIFVTGGLYIVNIEDRIHLDWVQAAMTVAALQSSQQLSFLVGWHSPKMSFWSNW